MPWWSTESHAEEIVSLPVTRIEPMPADTKAIAAQIMSEVRAEHDLQKMLWFELLLVLAAPENLDEKALFAVDQFLMRGGTVVLVSSPFQSQLTRGNLTMMPRNSGLQDWLQHHGVSL